MSLKQRIKYVWRIIGKLYSFFNFGLGSVVIATFIFPTIFTISFGSPEKFKRLGRIVVNKAFTLFVKQMQWARLLTFEVKNKERLQGLQSKVIIANHPSLLDVVMLMSIIPNADCLIKASLGGKNIMRWVVNRLYIPNSLDFEDIIRDSGASMDKGNCFIIFPEGTRTRPGCPFSLKKGAARIALATKRDVIPIYFGGNEKIGLRKYDKMLSFHPTQKYQYKLEVLDPISIVKYKDMQQSKAATLLTEEMTECFSKAKRAEQEREHT